ncbi:NUDIX domain-containing protein [Streptomyces mirabilis]|uniref:NUDIX domain-containing protein n=1 Tax=Streptomyces mirabilis TaxID=68239 RepID=UPI00331682AD
MIECFRAVLVTPAGGLLLICRTWSGAMPCRVFPGGHVEWDDPGLRAALVREIREESGAEPQITGLLHVLAGAHRRQCFYLARIRSWSEAGRTGPEFAGPDRGEYRLEEVPLSVRVFDALSLVPEEIAVLLRDAVTAGTGLAAVVARAW